MSRHVFNATTLEEHIERSTPSSYSARIPPEMWAEQEEYIRQLHGLSYTQDDMVELLAEEMDFWVSKQQLVRQLKKLGLTKYKSKCAHAVDDKSGAASSPCVTAAEAAAAMTSTGQSGLLFACGAAHGASTLGCPQATGTRTNISSLVRQPKILFNGEAELLSDHALMVIYEETARELSAWTVVDEETTIEELDPFSTRYDLENLYLASPLHSSISGSLRSFKYTGAGSKLHNNHKRGGSSSRSLRSTRYACSLISSMGDMSFDDNSVSHPDPMNDDLDECPSSNGD